MWQNNPKNTCLGSIEDNSELMYYNLNKYWRILNFQLSCTK